MANNNDGGSEDTDPKSLRAKLEQALAENKTLKDQVTKSTQRTALTEAKYSGLTDRQQKALWRELAEDEKEITPDNIKKYAEELGFKADTTADPPPPDPNAANGANGDGANDGNGQEGVEQQQVGPVDESLNAFAMHQAAEMAARGGKVSPDLDTKMKAAKSPEELTAIIRAEGSKSGLIHSWDVE